VCVAYDAAGFADVSNVHLLHFENNAWTDVTTTHDVLNHVICGQTSSLSPFLLAETIPATGGPTLTSVGESHAWIGLKNSDDQGTRFDLRAELYLDNTLITSGLTRCITGVTRNPNNALDAIVHFAAFSSVPLDSDDTLTLRLSTRIGTNPNDTKCPGHDNATGLRLYYDGATRQSRIGAELSPSAMTDYFLRSTGVTHVLSDQPPTGSTIFVDSPAVTFSGGNPWRTISEWTLTVP
jgi:hypothetical protein